MVARRDFVIACTPTGRHAVRRKGGSRALRTFCGRNSEKKAEQFVERLLKILNEEV